MGVSRITVYNYLNAAAPPGHATSTASATDRVAASTRRDRLRRRRHAVAAARTASVAERATVRRAARAVRPHRHRCRGGARPPPSARTSARSATASRRSRLSMVEAAITISERHGTDDGHRPSWSRWPRHSWRNRCGCSPHVPEVLAEVGAVYRLVLITKGDLVHQTHKITTSGLAHHFEHLEIVLEKDPTTYSRLLRRFGVEPDRFLMVGNSVRSDILPVHVARRPRGARAVPPAVGPGARRPRRAVRRARPRSPTSPAGSVGQLNGSAR